MAVKLMAAAGHVCVCDGYVPLAGAAGCGLHQLQDHWPVSIRDPAASVTPTKPAGQGQPGCHLGTHLLDSAHATLADSSHATRAPQMLFKDVQHSAGHLSVCRWRH